MEEIPEDGRQGLSADKPRKAAFSGKRGPDFDRMKARRWDGVIDLSRSEFSVHQFVRIDILNLGLMAGPFRTKYPIFHRSQETI